MTGHHFARVLTGCCVMLIASVSGCSRSNPESTVAALNQSNVQRLTNLYFAYQKNHDFNGPKDEADFRQFVQGIGAEKLERIGVDAASIDNLFVSERDGQPFNIRYRVKGSIMGTQEPVVFESQGVDGMRMVGFLDMSQREVDPTEYDQLRSTKTSGGSSRPGRNT